MIDYVKITINNNGLPERLRQNQHLNFERNRNRYTARKYRDLTFTVHDSGRVEVTGSLHKFWNDGAHNWNDFTRVDLWDTIHDFCRWLEVAPNECELHNVEFGVNLSTPFSPPELLRDLIAYKSYSFGRVSVRNGGTYYQAKNFDCFVKCYDKGAQYGRPDHLLRFEVKVKSMRYLSGADVRTLEDLMKADKLATLGAMLSEAWELVLIRERLPVAGLTAKERQIFETTTTTDLKTIDRKRRHVLLKDYRTLIERTLHGDGTPPDGTPPDRKKVVAGLIRDKWQHLTKGDVCNNPQPADGAGRPDVCNDLQPVAVELETGRLQRSGIVCKRPDVPPAKTPPSPTTTTATQPLTKTPILRRCKSTGIGIANQRKGSVFIGEKTAMEKPEEVKAKIGPRRINSRKLSCHDETYYTTHHARNDDSNTRNNTRRSIERAICQTPLFDPLEVLRLTPEQRQVMEYWKGTLWEVKGL